MADGGGPQFAKVPRWVFQHSSLSPGDLRVYTYLAWLASPGDECFPSLAAIGAGAPHVVESRDGIVSVRNRSRSSVIRSLNRLERFGAIQRHKRPGRNTIYAVFQSPVNVVQISQTTLELPVDKSVDNSQLEA